MKGRLLFIIFIMVSGFVQAQHHDSIDGCKAKMLQGNCIDLTDLYAPSIHCTYGTYWDPYSNQGVIPGRHTVMTHQGYDPYTNNQLSVIPPGETYSIRLGDSIPYSQAESIAVDILVDTNDFDLIFLKYAAVMRNLGHSFNERPQFKIDILDINDNPIDPDCLSADFVAGSSLDWEVYSIYRWKDWTHVGFDVTPFHDQTIRVRLTTYDCGEYRCFTYAYFLLTCGQKRITASGCGYHTQYEYSAPSGFYYDWFWRDDPSHSISHNQTVRVSPQSSRELGCHVTFVENSSCEFDLFTSTKRRFPLSGGTVAETECLNKFLFINESLISDDGFHPDGTGNPCDDVFWDFGDGQTSYDFSPMHLYSVPGDYRVSMVSGLSGFECTDTTYLTVHVPENTLVDTLVCEPFVWEDDVYAESGEYHKVFTTTSGCDSLVTLKLDANYPPEFRLHGDHWPIGGTELAWTQYTYNIVFDNPFCSVDSVRWSVDCPIMSVLPSDDGLSCELRIFSFLPANDSVSLRAIAYNRCGSEERIFWIHTSYYGIDHDGGDAMVLAVFPNPNAGVLNIRMKGMAGDVYMELYDSCGLLVEKWTQSNGSDDETLAYNTSRLREGLYTLRAIHNFKPFTRKVMVGK